MGGRIKGGKGKDGVGGSRGSKMETTVLEQPLN